MSDWLPWRDAVALTEASGMARPFRGQHTLAEWCAAGLVSARARVAIIDGEPHANWPIIKDAWKATLAFGSRYSVDREGGEMRSGWLDRGGRRIIALKAHGIEIAPDELASLLPPLAPAGESANTHRQNEQLKVNGAAATRVAPPYQRQSHEGPALKILRKFLVIAQHNGWLDRAGTEYRSMEKLLPDYQARCKKEKPTPVKPFEHSAFNKWVGRFNRGEWS